MNLGIIGIGFVGGATAHVLKNYHNLYLYDKYKNPYNKDTDLENLAKNSECVFISVPTPMKKNGAVDYSNLYDSIENLLNETNKLKRNPKDILVIIRSTAVSGTTDKLSKEYPFKFAFNPEFLREKYAIEDMEKTDRVVIGANDKESQEKLKQIYKPVFPNAKFFLTNTKTAEMVKYMANVMLTGQIALANQFYLACDSMGINYNEVKDIVLCDPRIGRNLDVPGPDGDLGFGGKCFPKDLRAFTYLIREFGLDSTLLDSIWNFNMQIRKNKDWLNIEGATSDKNFGEVENTENE
jgi:UDPglucose 6-dehydrogenase